ncbi:MAG: SDR family oxidoreductase, partial [Desulfobacteraceae bacterium]|nr:SDR family oxidoreductase [Desulfobacteraceae bacterium]
MNLLILGGNSDTAFAVAHKFAEKKGANIILASRDAEALKKKAKDIEIRHQVKAEPIFFDATDYESHKEFYNNLDPKPDGVVTAFGYLGDQKTAQHDFHEAKKIIETNYLGVAEDFEKKGRGFIIGISSVAGERGRQSNYFYGSAKGAMTVYLSGLRNRLQRSSVQVTTILPGFIQTKMTENLDLPEKLLATPQDVAEDIYKACVKKRDVIYTR